MLKSEKSDSERKINVKGGKERQHKRNIPYSWERGENIN
jgi:hypothetical protein